MRRRAAYGVVPRTRKQRVVELCVAALGPYYAGQQTVGEATVLLGYSDKQPVPVARVSRRRSATPGSPDVKLQVLRPDIVNVFDLEHWLGELADEDADGTEPR